MSRIRKVRFGPLGHILAGGAVLALLVAACSPASSAGTPTVAPLGTSLSTEALTTPLASEVATSGASTELATSASTEAATTGASTEVATSASTEAATTGASTEAATSAATTGASTEVATAAGTTVANAPLLIESDKLLGMSVMDSSGAPAGTISDVLVDMTGTVQAVVLNLSTSGTPVATSASSTQVATSAATAAATSAATEMATAASTSAVSTQTSTNANMVAVPWTSIKADPTTKQLTYQGAASDLASMTAFDESKVSSGYVIRAQTAGVPATYDGLVRLGGTLSDINLQTPTNEKLGALQHVIIDMQSGMATYAVVDFGTFLGVTSQPVLVPWNKLQLDNADQTSMTPVVHLNVTKSSLSSAPKFDETTLSFWPTPANKDWDSQIQIFWQTAAS